MSRSAASAADNDVVGNRRVAAVLREIADVLTEQQANPFRIRAYRHAADTIDGLNENVRSRIAREGTAGLKRLPGIGSGLAATIEEIVRTGEATQLERLRGGQDPEVLLRTVPGIGPRLAELIHDELHVETLEALEAAAHDGRLDSLPGLGPRRVAAIKASLASMLGRNGGQRPSPADSPSVAMLLDVDREYRRSARDGRLPRIAPRRFNPGREAWLPVLHTDRGGYHFTVLFSNTARAHQLGRTNDWVVVYFYDGDHREGQHTIVTESRGELAGRRVVRGREAECEAFYGQPPA